MRKIWQKINLKNQKGSITLFVTILMIFFVIMGAMLYINSQNKNIQQSEQVAKIQSEYNATTSKLEEKYEEIIEKGTQNLKNTVTYNYKENGGTSANKESERLLAGTTVNYTAIKADKPGRYEFVGWNTNKDATVGLTGELKMPNEDITLYAIYKKDIVVTFHYYNKQSSTISKTIYNKAKEISITTPSISNTTINGTLFTQRGWGVESNDEELVTIPANSSINISDDTIYYASYSANITITYNANGGANAPGAETKTVYMNYMGTTSLIAINKNTPTKTGYTFKSWNTASNGSGTSYTAGQSIKLDTNVTFYAMYEINKYNVTYKSSNLLTNLYDTSGTSGRMTYTVKNEVVTVTATGDDGYGYTNGRVYLEAGKTYTFNCETNGAWGGNGNDTVEAFLMLDGSTSTAYYHMSSQNYSFAPTVTGTYWLRLDVNQNGKTYTFSQIRVHENIKTENKDYNSDVDLNLTVTRKGYTFKGWNTDYKGTTWLSSLKVPANNITIYAINTPIAYTVTLKAPRRHAGTTWKWDIGEKVYTCNYGSYFYIGNYTSVFTAPTGYYYGGASTDDWWNVGSDGAQENYTGNSSNGGNSIFTVTGNMVAQLHYYPITYTVAYNGNGATGGSTASSSHTYDAAKTLTANGFIKTGWTFNGWNTKADGSGTNYSNSQSVTNLTSTRNGTVTLYAKWKDTTPPTITVSPASATVCKSKSVKITVADTGGSGLASNSYQYYLSTSSTGFAGGAWTNYTSGTAFTIGSGKTGTYYLWVKRVKDNAGNVSSSNNQTVSSVVYHRYGTYVFDNTVPTITISPTSATACKSKSVKITVADTGGSGLASNSYQYYLSTSSTGFAGGAWTTYTSGTAFTIGSGKTGTYYLWVKQIKDKAGNVSEGWRQTVSSVIYHRYGTYVFDNTAPGGVTVTYNGGANSCSWKNNYNITLSASDSSGISNYEVDNNGDGAANHTTGSNFIPGNGYSSHTVRFRAVDKAGNKGVWTGNHHIHMDTQAPSKTTVNLNGYTSGTWADADVTQTASATDNVKVSFYEYSHDKAGVTKFPSNPWTINWNGEWNFYVRAVDLAGNRGAWSDMYTIRRNVRTANVTGIYEGSVLYINSQPASGYTIGRLHNNDQVWIHGESGSWWYVYAHSRIMDSDAYDSWMYGWVYKGYITTPQ